jgi:tetratricopeptide (TPR) repeat protein
MSKILLTFLSKTVVLASALTISLAQAPVIAFDIFGGSESLLREGQDMMEQGKLLEARQLLEQAIQKDPQNAEAYATLGTCLERQSAPRLAEQAYLQAIKLDANNKAALNNLAALYWVHMKRYGESVELYKKVAAIDPSSTEAYVNLGAAYNFWAANDKKLSPKKKQETFDLGIKSFQESIRLDPDFAKAHANLGQCYLFMGRAADAERELILALQLEPTYAFAHFNLAELYEAQEKLQEAMQHYKASYENEAYESNKVATVRHIERVELKMGTAKLLSVANLRMRQGKWAEAADAFATAMNDPKSSRSGVAWNNFGYVLAKMGKHHDAAARFQKAMTMNPAPPAAFYNLGHSLRSMGDKAGAEKAFEAAITAGGGQHALAHNSLGILLKEQGRFNEANQHYRIAVLQSGDELDVAHYNWAILLEKMGKPKEALQQYELYLSNSSQSCANRPRARARMEKLISAGVKTK